MGSATIRLKWRLPVDFPFQLSWSERARWFVQISRAAGLRMGPRDFLAGRPATIAPLANQSEAIHLELSLPLSLCARQCLMLTADSGRDKKGPREAEEKEE